MVSWVITQHYIKVIVCRHNMAGYFETLLTDKRLVLLPLFVCVSVCVCVAIFVVCASNFKSKLAIAIPWGYVSQIKTTCNSERVCVF